MNSQSTGQKSLEHIKNLRSLFASKRTPSSGSINLTHRCNLQCVHCYLGDRNSTLRSPETELDTPQWLEIIDQITEAGCLNLLITGGDPLLRKDFKSIYRKAVTNGILTTVFTNGTLITQDVLDLFEDIPPQSIEITLYGATPETYEKITGIKGSYEKSIKGIEKLAERGLRFKLKTMLITQNIKEWHEIKRIADRFGVDFRSDPAISACLDGNQAPLQCRVDPAEAVQVDFAEPEHKQFWCGYYEKNKEKLPSKFLYNCGAGLTHFHINAAGKLLPCMMLNEPVADLKKRRFIDGWKNEIARLRIIKASEDYKCNACDKRGLCSGCPAFFLLENGSPEIPSEYLCKIAQQRFEAIR
jgi:radical SAM protein with 4Fe4S-binding SPASM domain